MLDEGDNLHHINFIKNNISVELHFALFDEEVSSKWVKYFNNPFELSKLNEKCLYQFNDTEHFIYCLCNFAKHLRTGAGVRYILDFYYILKKTNIDYVKLHNDLEILGLSKFYNNVLNVINYLTNERIDEFENIDCNFFVEYLLQSGIHGNDGIEDKLGFGVAEGNKFLFIMTRLFLVNKQYRKTMYPKFGNHWYLYPICLVIHWYYLFKSGFRHKLKTLVRIMFCKNRKKDLYRKLGI